MKIFTNTILILAMIILTSINSFADNNKHFDKPLDGIGSGVSFSDDYKLFQNFPNPFNPVTKLSYKINKEGVVTLKVYNLVGQVLKVLVSEYQKPGRYEVAFDGSEFSTGIYLYKLQVNDFTSVKRMTLLK
jgi:hypothetical protein